MTSLGYASHPPRVVAFVPARGGSKGVPGKNLREVGGVTLVARAIGSALCTEHIDRVVVSTDDDRIEAAAIAEGADVVLRPAELSGDTATSEAALLHAAEAIDWAVDVLVFLQATSPFIRPSDLDSAIERVVSGECDVVFSVAQSHAFLWRQGGDGVAAVNHDPSFRVRRQDREPEYVETGAFYVMDAAGFRLAGFRFFGTVGLVEVDPRTVVEIDSEADLQLARALAPIVDPRAGGPVDTWIPENRVAPPRVTYASTTLAHTHERN